MNAVYKWNYKGIRCWLGQTRQHNFCGYAGFPLPLDNLGTEGLAAKVKVHGAISFAEPAGDMFVYGWDDDHWGHLIADRLEDAVAETERMVNGILELLS